MSGTWDGLLLVDKPSGPTSHDVVARLRKALKQKSIGHTGTLDPLATGLMIAVAGEATKISDYLMTEDKDYTVVARLGVRTDTLDRDGEVLERRPVELSDTQIHQAVEQLTGQFEWPVPMFSAAKVDGKPLHEMARRGQVIDTPVKAMVFWKISWRRLESDLIEVNLSCSKGSFVRSWVDQLGQRLGTGAIVEELRRTRIGGWSVADARALADIEADGQPGPGFVRLAEALPGLRAVLADSKEARLISNGQIPRDLVTRLIPEQKQAFSTSEPVLVKVLSNSGDLLALLSAQSGQGLKIRRVFHPQP